ncbi:ABC transporter ATP-binding protein [Galbibacter marinus]|uniref:ABC transporter ATP-binding protein n=1 Tax=Galbibacter marinus TaxID=555500 RepID=K2P0W3_9FLAO|nr:ATP-binding cassette domain-containing protein [Galbibacter marinus]EKF54678.1 ABC transporter ATP-binding protein [Galbibacter marinus]
MNSLHVDNVVKSFNGKVILSDVFLSCQKGEIKGLIGRNGSGKSTLLKIIFGTVRADSKFVRIGDKVIKNITYGRNLINYMPQDSFLPNNISIKDLINLFLHKENRKSVLEDDYIRPLLNKKNQALSAGERRIIEVLLLINSNAEFILLDEPFNGVSPIVGDYIIDCIKKMKSSKGFIVTDHDYERVMSLADSIVYLQNGYLKKINNKSELLKLGYFPETQFIS